MHKTSNSHNSLISQPNPMVQSAELSTKQDLQESSINFMNYQTRNLTFFEAQVLNRAYQALKMQNRNSMILALMNGTRFVC
jgi:hypothetical protein